MSFVNKFFVVTMFLLLLNTVEAGDSVRCKESERRALLEFRAGVADEFGVLSSWGNSSTSDKECCDWKGIRCSNLTGHVTLLNLPGHVDFAANSEVMLRGKVSPSLCELSHLKYLNLSNNFFSGEIPYQLGNLISLRFLDLSGNEFNGKIPRQLGNLTNLRSLDLEYNYNLKAQNLDWVSSLQSLTRLVLSSVDLSSCNNWLNQIHKLSSLTHLQLGDCLLPEPSLRLVNTSFSAFESLVVVDLSHNNFISPESYSWIFNFTTTLVDLRLSRTSFQRNEIPEVIGRIISLESLYLFDCELEGTLPNSFRNLSRLETLVLSENYLNGSLSEFLHPLAAKEKNSLQFIRLDSNQLEGSLPDYFTSCPFLQSISISHNKLSGSFPNNFWQLSSGLVTLDLSHNQISGQVPNLTLFSSLQTLELNNNKLEDKIPEAYLSNLSNLKALDLSYNSLSMEFSSYWVPPFQLGEILLHNCSLGPRFPNWLQSQRRIITLGISSAGISDTIPSWFGDLLPKVIYLNISHNNIQGKLPDLSYMSSLSDWFGQHIDVSSNNLTGPIPRLPAYIDSLDLSRNKFTGSLSFLCTASYENFVSLRLSDNQLSGELPDCWINVPVLHELNLANNTFSGKLPTSMGLLSELEILQVRNNNISGELPSSLMNCSKLRLLDLSDNELSGEVPSWIGTQLTDLIIFSLSKNNFFGTIPNQICLLAYVQVVDLSRNNLWRSIPNCVDNFTALQQSDYEDHNRTKYIFLSLGSLGDDVFTSVPSAYLQWKGQKSLYGKNLGLLKLIDFSSNRLVGEIPEEFGSLKGLMSLNLSSNHLKGSIIPSIGQMNALEVLDLSGNNLTGDIPASLSNLTFLSVLDLSNNKLTGRIPSGTQLQSFSSLSYAGNDRLCGLPLPDKCPNDQTKVYPPGGGHGNDENIEEYEDRFITIWFYISLVLGFVMGFWGFVGPIMVRSSWRVAYFRFLEKTTDWIYVTTSLTMAWLHRKIYS